MAWVVRDGRLRAADIFVMLYFLKENVYFWPFNSCQSLFLAIKLQYHSNLAIVLFWYVVLIIFIYNLVLITWNNYYVLLVPPILVILAVALL
jgi:hypothetical protein